MWDIKIRRTNSEDKGCTRLAGYGALDHTPADMARQLSINYEIHTVILLQSCILPIRVVLSTHTPLPSNHCKQIVIKKFAFLLLFIFID